MPVDWIHSVICLLFLSLWLLIAQIAVRQEPRADAGWFNHQV